MIAIVITSIVAWPVDALLVFLIKILDAKKDKDAQIQMLARKAAIQVAGVSVSALSDAGEKKNSVTSSIDLAPNSAVAPSRSHRRQAVLGSSSIVPLESTVVVAVSTEKIDDLRTKYGFLHSCRNTLTILQLQDQAPSAPPVVIFTRSTWLKDMDDLFGTSIHHLHRSSYSHMNASANSKELHIRSAEGVFGTAVAYSLANEQSEKLYRLMQDRLRYASDTEYGMCLLQILYYDLLTVKRNSFQRLEDVDLWFSSMFCSILDKNFVIEPSSSEHLQRVIVAFLIVVNLGTLYFVLLKGISRGYDWQISLLRVCLLQWMTQVLLHETVQVYFLHFLIPNTIYDDIQSRLAALLLITCTWIQCEENSKAHKVHNFESRNDANFVALKIALEKPDLLESQLVCYFISHFRLHLDSKKVQEMGIDFVTANNSWLRLLAKQSIKNQSLAAFACSLLIYGVMHTVWYNLRPNVWSIPVMVAIVLIIVSAIIAVFLRIHWKTLAYYSQSIQSNLSFATIWARIAELDEHGNDEEVGNKKVQLDCEIDDDNSWSLSSFELSEESVSLPIVAREIPTNNVKILSFGGSPVQNTSVKENELNTPSIYFSDEDIAAVKSCSSVQDPEFVSNKMSSDFKGSQMQESNFQMNEVAASDTNYLPTQESYFMSAGFDHEVPQFCGFSQEIVSIPTTPFEMHTFAFSNAFPPEEALC
jgi:hypothetical protein